MGRRILKTSSGLHLISQFEDTLIDPKGGVIQRELFDLAQAAIVIKLQGHRVVVAVSEAPLNGATFFDQVYREGYAAMVVSQTKLMSEWKKCLDHFGEMAAQILVDAVVFHNRHRGQQLASVLTELTDMGVIPIVGLSAAGRGVGGDRLDSFLANLLEKQASVGLHTAAI
ncbi:hypothetical protein [Pseudomonas putida]